MESTESSVVEREIQCSMPIGLSLARLSKNGGKERKDENQIGQIQQTFQEALSSIRTFCEQSDIQVLHESMNMGRLKISGSKQNVDRLREILKIKKLGIVIDI